MPTLHALFLSSGICLLLVSCAAPETATSKTKPGGPARTSAGMKHASTPRAVTAASSITSNEPPTSARVSTNEVKKAEEEKKPEPIKPYGKVITKDAKSDRGVFTVHRVEDKFYFEIPTNELGRDFLWVTQIARTQAGYGYGGGTPVGNRVVRWVVRDKDVLLRDVKYAIRAEGDDSIRHSVEVTSVPAIIRKFPVAAWGTNKAAVIDVTDFFSGDVPEFSAKSRLNSSGADRARSFIERIKSFPDNIETKVTMTYALSGGAPPLNTIPPSGAGGRDPSQSAVTILLHHSMVRLPEKPMQPRERDSRVGFFSTGFEDFGSAEHGVKQVRYITRWRLEKKDPDAEVSEPRKPIVFYVGRGVPDKWRAYIKQGIEAWQPAFESAGFKNAIVAKDAPSEQEDPDWDAEDARYSTIQWLPSTIENAMGPHVHDPRTGEILESDILVYHNILKLTRDWYFVQVSPMDPRAQKLPLPDDLLGELLAYVITHEVGHTLGFPHNMKASSSYTVEQLRDPAFTRKHGVEASIMDYGRYNYVAQPGDGAALIPIVGPYDFFAVEWGYKQFRSATNAWTEKAQLNQIVSRQVSDPKLRFGDPNPGVDPSQQTEDLGSDPVKATALGLKNIARVAAMLVSATCEEGKDYELLSNMYTQLIRQRDRELGHVASEVGGLVMNNVWYGQGDHIFDPVPPEKQREAVAFLNENAFHVPAYLVDPNILRRLEGTGAADRFMSSQRGLLAALLDESRCKRMAELANAFPDQAYSPAQLLVDLRTGIFSELSANAVEISLYRRNLQRAFVEQLGSFAIGTSATSDMPALARAALKTIQAETKRSVDRSKDDLVKAHLEDVQARIERILEPKGPTPPRQF